MPTTSWADGARTSWLEAPEADALFGGLGVDVLRAGAGFDGPLIGDGDDDVIDGGRDGGTVSFLFASEGVIVDLSLGTATGEGQDVVSGVTSVIGSRFDDLIIGTDGNNRLEGEDGDDAVQSFSGDDLLVGGPGNDRLEGGDGSRDEARFRTARLSVDVDLTAGTAVGQGADTLVGVEDVSGSAFGDFLYGDAAANALTGWDGDDVISGLAGDDYLQGEQGGNTLDGGDGDDTCADGKVVACEQLVVTDPTFILRITHRSTVRCFRPGVFTRSEAMEWGFSNRSAGWRPRSGGSPPRGAGGGALGGPPLCRDRATARCGSRPPSTARAPGRFPSTTA